MSEFDSWYESKTKYLKPPKGERMSFGGEVIKGRKKKNEGPAELGVS